MIGQQAPDEGTHDGAAQRREGQQRDRGLVDAVFHAHAGRHKAQAGRLHDVDDQRDAEHHHQPPMRARQLRIFRRRDGGDRAGDDAAPLPWAKGHIPPIAVPSTISAMPASMPVSIGMPASM